MPINGPVKQGDPLSAKEENINRSNIAELMNVVVPAEINKPSGSSRRYGIIKTSTATGIEDDDDNDIQWTYTISEVFKTLVGYGNGAFTDINADGAKYGWTEDSGIAYNFAEEKNSTSGVQGNGIDIDNDSYTGTSFEFIPCPVGTIVEFGLFPVANADGSTTIEAWFYWHNPVDGEC